MYKRIERVILAKIDEFIPHYLVKILSINRKEYAMGSEELYDQLILKVREAMNDRTLKYSDMLRFFEIFPEVTHIY